jgi:Icc-related predicted phosphoesterase
MKILALSDLHGRRAWYNWISTQASKFDAIVVAGDLLDMFQDPSPQIVFLRDWVARMQVGGTPLFLCDGNHDANSTALSWSPNPKIKYSPEQAAFIENARVAEHWMDALVQEGASAVSGMSNSFPELDSLVVTSLLYGRENEEANASLLEQGARLRRGSRGSPWMVLNHEPPFGLIGSPEQGNQLFGEWIEEFQPQVTFSGHDHDSPARNEACCERIGLTYAFNPGHNPDGKMPCHIVLETKTMKYTWHQ